MLAEVAKKYGVAVGAATLAAGAGFLTGYYIAKHRLEDSIHEAAEQEIAEQVEAARRYFTVVKKEKEYETPADAVEELIPEAAEALRTYVEKDAEEAMSLYQGKELKEEGEPEGKESEAHSKEEPIAYHRARLFREEERATTVIPAPRRNNLWDNAKPMVDSVDFDYRDEVAARTEEAPYIISEEEFLENQYEHRQFKLTYFAGDGFLIDHNDEIIHDIDGFIGENNLRFGHRSNDNRIVYIRSHVLDLDFQVALSSGNYAQEVAGFDPE